MSEVQSIKQFERRHVAGCKNLEIEKEYLLRKTTSGLLHRVHVDLAIALDQIHRNLSPDDPPSPSRTFRAAMKGLDEIDAKRFLLHNVLESLKQGQTEKQITDNYVSIGLLKRSTAQTMTKETSTSFDTGAEALGSLQSLKRAGLALCQISVNAIKSIPKFVEIDPGIMLVGFVPVPTFTLKGKGVTVHELFELLRKPGRFYQETPNRERRRGEA